MAALTFSAFFSLKWEIMGTLKKMGIQNLKKGPLGDPFGSSDNGDRNMKVAMILFFHAIVAMYTVPNEKGDPNI